MATNSEETTVPSEQPPTPPTVTTTASPYRNILCRFQMDGRTCRTGQQCLFSHDPNAPYCIREEEDVCWFYLLGHCWFGEYCRSVHLDRAAFIAFNAELSIEGTEALLCELCGYYCLHPDDQQQRAQHRDECVREHERKMKLSFGFIESQDKMCIICHDNVFDKLPGPTHMFGILQNCSHVYCLTCIRRWRDTLDETTGTVRVCTICKKPSNYVIPSEYWCDDPSEKQELIESYKEAMKTIPCKYFVENPDNCWLRNDCFYLHAGPDGRQVVMPPREPENIRLPRFELVNVRNSTVWHYVRRNLDARR